MAAGHWSLTGRRAAWLAIAATVSALCSIGVAHAWAVRVQRTQALLAQAGPIDVGFAQSMAQHHDQAIAIAQITVARGDGRLRGVAQGILNAQLIELGEMRGWLNLWGRPQLPSSRAMGWMLSSATRADPAVLNYLFVCRSAPGGMPGLATVDQLARLRQLDGAALEQEFLRLMIRHHRGGLPMARFASLFAETKAVREMAGRVVVEQGEEIGWMSRTLAATTMGGATLAP